MNSGEKSQFGGEGNAGVGSLAEMPSFEEMREKRENFGRLTKFLKQDKKVKKMLMAAAPGELNSEEAAVEYSDNLMNMSQEIGGILTEMAEGKYYEDTIKNDCREIEQRVVEAGADGVKLLKAYREDFAAMDEGLINRVNKATKSGSLLETPFAYLGEARSYNEILHILHSGMMCDGEFLQSLPVIAENTEYDRVTLYGMGDGGTVARGIYDEFCAWPENERDNDNETDIVEVDGGHVMLMVRGKGHSLSVNIEKDDDGAWYVDYVVPKICNVDKVNLLPGVRQVVKRPGMDQAKEATSGAFRVKDENAVARAIGDFVRAVPDDNDIEY